jgi:hypothetical protein
VRWENLAADRPPDLVRLGFARAAGGASPVRAPGPRSQAQARTLPLRPREAHAALLRLRQRPTTPAFRARDGQRAGSAGTISPDLRVAAVRHARSRGLGKPPLPKVALATALNLDLLAPWVAGLPRLRAKPSPFATRVSLTCEWT